MTYILSLALTFLPLPASSAPVALVDTLQEPPQCQTNGYCDTPANPSPMGPNPEIVS